MTLRELREERGLTRIAVALKLGVTEQTVTNYEDGKAPSVANLMKLADFYGVTTDFILGREKGEQ